MVKSDVCIYYAAIVKMGRFTKALAPCNGCPDLKAKPLTQYLCLSEMHPLHQETQCSGSPLTHVLGAPRRAACPL